MQGHESLIRADVAGGFFAADVLFAGLQGQHPAALAVAIDCLADEPARHLADVLLPAGQETQIGTAVGHRIAQALALGDGNVRAIFPRPFQQAQADRIEADDE